MKKSERHLPKHKWYLADALLIVRELQAKLWPLGFHVALGGGVLNHGYSNKDLDLYVLPFCNVTHQSLDRVQDEVDGVLGGVGEPIDVTIDPNYHTLTLDTVPAAFAHRLKYNVDSARVDVFIVDPACQSNS